MTSRDSPDSQSFYYFYRKPSQVHANLLILHMCAGAIVCVEVRGQLPTVVYFLFLFPETNSPTGDT